MPHWQKSFAGNILNVRRSLRDGFQADTPLWVCLSNKRATNGRPYKEPPNVRWRSPESVCGSLRGGLLKKAPLARRLRRGFQSQLGAHSGCSASAAQKFLRDLKGAFFKKPPFLLAFLLIVFLCACALKEKRLRNLTRQRKE